jgi:hypothetical protein
MSENPEAIAVQKLKEAAASSATEPIEDEAQEGKKEKKDSQAKVLVGLGLEAGVELFHSPEGEAYATLPIDGRRETWPLRTKTVKRWLSRLYFLATESAPGSQAIADALGVLEGKATDEFFEPPPLGTKPLSERIEP